MTSTNKRSQAREYAFQFFYHLHLPEFRETLADLTENFCEETLDHALEDFDPSYAIPDKDHQATLPSGKERHFALNLLRDTLKNYHNIKEELQGLSRKWNLDRMDRVDLSILILGAAELKGQSGTPRKVVLNESVQMAKKFGSKDSFTFINGVLDALLKN